MKKGKPPLTIETQYGFFLPAKNFEGLQKKAEGIIADPRIENFPQVETALDYIAHAATEPTHGDTFADGNVQILHKRQKHWLIFP